MSILIKGMKMPTGCSALTLKVWPDSQVEIIDADGEWKTSKAIPVPPHGRLIDADVLTKQIKRDGITSDPFVRIVCDYFNDAPTVISADKDGET